MARARTCVLGLGLLLATRPALGQVAGDYDHYTIVVGGEAK